MPHLGIKFITLRTPGGEIIPGSGLFVKIKKVEHSTTFSESTEKSSDNPEATSSGSSRSINSARDNPKDLHRPVRLDKDATVTDRDERDETYDSSELDSCDGEQSKSCVDDEHASDVFVTQQISNSPLFEATCSAFRLRDGVRLSAIVEVHEQLSESDTYSSKNNSFSV